VFRRSKQQTNISEIYVYKAVDIWAAGCVFAELLSNKVMFPGRDHLHQMDLIITLLGTPDKEAIDMIAR